MRAMLIGFVMILISSGAALAGNQARSEFGQAFDGLGRLEVYDLRCNGSKKAAVIRDMKARMMTRMGAFSERAAQVADIWYEFGKLRQARDWEDGKCGAQVPSIEEIRNHFEDGLSYKNAGI